VESAPQGGAEDDADDAEGGAVPGRRRLFVEAVAAADVGTLPGCGGG
jgi:hypothetical protein